MSIHDDDRYFPSIHDDSQTLPLRFNANTSKQVRKPLNLKSHCGTNYNTIVAWNLFYRKPKIESEIRPRGSQLNYGHSKTLQETSGAPQ